MLRFCNISSFLCLFFRRDLARPIGVPVKVGNDFWGMGIPYKVRPREPPNLILRFEEPLRRVRVHAFPEGSLKSRSGLRDWVNTHFTIPTKGLSLMQQPLVLFLLVDVSILDYLSRFFDFFLVSGVSDFVLCLLQHPLFC